MIPNVNLLFTFYYGVFKGFMGIVKAFYNFLNHHEEVLKKVFDSYYCYVSLPNP